MTKIGYLRLFVLFIVLIGITSCSKEDKRFDVEVTPNKEKVRIFNLASDYYNSTLTFEEIKKKYPFYVGNDPIDKIEAERKDTLGINLFKAAERALKKIDLQNELATLFARVQHYFPKFKYPDVYLYSSYLKDYQDPVAYYPEENKIFISIDCFLGDGHKYYRMFRIERYFQKTMSPEYLIPRVSKAIALHVVPFNHSSKTFLNYLIFEGKLMLMQDAFLFGYPDYLKIEFTPEQLEWCIDNEYFIWNAFVEDEILFSTEGKLVQRFLAPAPFSTFYREIDKESPGRVGCWVGWQIVKKYAEKHKDMPITKIILNPDFNKIFKESNYKPTLDE